VDEFVLLIHPLVLGTGTRLFQESPAIPFELVDAKTSSRRGDRDLSVAARRRPLTIDEVEGMRERRRPFAEGT
jgi:hypothetical protein